MITVKEYAARRRDLMSMMAPNSIAIVTGAGEKIRSRDTHYPFKQATSFSYLCGFAEPQAVLGSNSWSRAGSVPAVLS